MNDKLAQIVSKGLMRHKQIVDNIVNDPKLTIDDKQQKLSEMFYELIDNGSYTDWCFATGYLDDTLERL